MTRVISCTILRALVACLLCATVSTLRGQADGGSTPGDNASRRQTLGQPLAPHPRHSGNGLQRGPSGAFLGLARNSIRSPPQGSGDANAPTGNSSWQGAFGERRLGQPLAPRPGQPSGGLQRGPSGAFLGLAGNSNTSIPPQRSSDADASAESSDRQEALGDRWLGQPLAPETASGFDSLDRDEGGEFPRYNGALSGFPPLGADTTQPPLNGPESQRGQARIYSAVLSEHLTRLARSGGVRTSTGVRVYLCGDGVVLEGEVDSLQQSQLIVSLVLLEPGVWSVDNRLTSVMERGYDSYPVE